MNYVIENRLLYREICLRADAFHLMEEKKVNVLPVVDMDYKPIGMIHIHNLMNLGL